MRFARNSCSALFSKLSFRVCFRELLRDLPDTFWDAAFPSFCFVCVFLFKCTLALESHFLANVASGYLPVSFRILPKTNSNLFRGMGRCVHSHQMGSGSQIALFGKRSFRIPSPFLPDSTRD